MPQERQLWEALGVFATTMIAGFSVPAILDHLVFGISAILPETSAAVTLTSSGPYLGLVAASDDLARRWETVQGEAEISPRLISMSSGQPVEVPVIGDDPRFVGFVERTRPSRLQAVYTFPLRHDHRQLGTLSLYRRSTDPLSPRALAAAQTLADVAAAYLVTAEVRTDLLDSAHRAHELTRHDALTGLPNRDLLLERLEQAVLRSTRTRKLAAVLFIDLDNFKALNDAFGHRWGDALLIEVGLRLCALLRPTDTVARLHADEFALLCEELEHPDQVGTLMIRVDTALQDPITVSGREFTITASVGITVVDAAGEDAEQVLRDAESAMNDAKRGGGSRFTVFDPRYQHLADSHAGLARDLRGALRRNELHLEYQPVVRAGDERIIGFEALLRWAHPRLGRVAPDLFIPIAEQAGLINEIGDWVLRQALADRNRWGGGEPTDDLSIAVNVSAHQLMSNGFVGSVVAALNATGTPSRLLEIELTESVFVRDSGRALQVLEELKDVGVGLALDDFGTGYSSLSYLRRFPVDTVKIDRAFVRDLESDEVSRIIVNAVIALAHALQLTVVAEGIETAEQHRKVVDLGCDSCQGYFFGRPMSLTAVDAMVAARRLTREQSDIGC